MAGYASRQSTYTDGDTILATHSNSEFNQILAGFNSSTGHKHDGTAGEGATIDIIVDNDSDTKVTVENSADEDTIRFFTGAGGQQVNISDGKIEPQVDNDVDLGSASKGFKNLYVVGTTTLGGTIFTGTLDLDGKKLILDADADTSITADTDDQIDIEISGADDFRFTANTFTVLSGSSLVVPSGATLDVSGGTLTLADDQISGNKVEGGTINAITINTLTLGTAVASHIIPSADDTYDLGSGSNEFRNLYIDGTANIDVAAIDSGTATALTITTATINGGTATLSSANITTGTVGTLSLTNDLALTEGGTGASTAAGARTNLGLDGLASYNPVLNSDMAVDQINSGTAVTLSGGDTNKLVGPDGWKGTFVGVGIADVSRTALPTCSIAGIIPSHALKVDVSTIDGSLAATDRYTVQLALEGRDLAWMRMGTANAQTFTVSFFVSSPLTGTFEVALQNSAADRSYIGQVTVSQADTVERLSFTVTGDTSGTWLTDDGTGLRLLVNLGCGSNFQTTAGAWQAGNFVGTSSGQNRMANAGYNTYVSGFQIDPGSVMLPYRGSDIMVSRRRCRRYLRVLGGADYAHSNPFLMGGGLCYSTTNMEILQFFDDVMRGTPTVTIADATRFTVRDSNSTNVDTTAVSPFARLNFIYGDWTVGSGVLTVGDSSSLSLDDSAGTGKIIISAANT